MSQILLISSVAPYMLQTDSNPDGVPQNMIDEIVENIYKDRPGFLSTFNKQFFGVSILNHTVSDGILNRAQSMALPASLKATIDCVLQFSHTGFRNEMQSINVPALVIHENADETVPIAATGEQAAKMLPQADYFIYEDEPHWLFYTAKDKLTGDLVEFITGAVIYVDDEDEDDEAEDDRDIFLQTRKAGINPTNGRKINLPTIRDHQHRPFLYSYFLLQMDHFSVSICSSFHNRFAHCWMGVD